MFPFMIHLPLVSRLIPVFSVAGRTRHWFPTDGPGGGGNIKQHMISGHSLLIVCCHDLFALRVKPATILGSRAVSGY